jgi:hypothetical protein
MSIGISKRNSISNVDRRSTSSPLILVRSFLKIVGAINIGKGEVMFDIDGVRSAFKSTMIRGMSKESFKSRRKTYSKARSIRLCGGWRRWR